MTMQAIMRWINTHPRLSIFIALLISFLCALLLPYLKIDTSSTGLVIKDSPEAQFYESSKEIFGDDNTLAIVYKAENIFQRSILQSIEDLSFEAEEIEGISRVISLSTVNNLHSDADGYLNTEALLAYVPETEEEIAQIRENSLANELIHGEVMNREGTVAAIQLALEDQPDNPSFNREIATKIEALLERERLKLGDQVSLYQIGHISLSNAMMDYIIIDLMTLTPLALIALMIVLYSFFRTGATILLPVITGSLSVVVSLGLMVLLDFAINPMSLIVPALLLIIGSTEDIHILAEYERGLRTHQEKHAAIKHMAMRSGLVIFLTSLTTFAGFITLGVNIIPMISEFGIIAGLGIVVNFVLTILIASPLLAALPIPNTFVKPEKEFLSTLNEKLVLLVTKHRKKIFIGSLLFMLGSGSAIFFLKIDSNYLAFFREDAPVRQLIDDVNENLSGAKTFFVIVDTQKENGLKDSDNLKAIAKLSDYLSEHYGVVMSYDRFIRKTHKEMNNGSEDFFTIPDSEELIAQYTLLVEPDTLARFADFDFQKAALVVRTNIIGSNELNKNLTDIKRFVEEELPIRMDVNITGGAILVAQASDQISRELLINLAIMLIVIFLVISLLFHSVKAGLLAMLPNSLPIFGALATMSLLDIPLSTGTFPVVIIALGIAVDDTLHFMIRFAKESKTTTDNHKAIAATIQHEIKPILGTSLALILGFLSLMFAEFASIAQFGLLSAITIALALLADLIITPALLLTMPLITYWDLLRLSIKEDFIQSTPLFKGLKLKQVKYFTLMGNIQKAKPNEPVIIQGNKDNYMLLVLKGELDICITGDNGKRKNVGRILASSIVGEMELLSQDTRTASVYAASDVELLKIDASTLERVERHDPKMAARIHRNIAEILASRLKITTRDYVQASYSKEI